MDPEEATKSDVSHVKLTPNYHNGGTFDEVATAFTGLLVVDNVEPEYLLCQSENVLMRNDLSEARRKSMSPCLVDVKNRCVVPLMGGDVPCGSTYASQRFFEELLEAQGATLVASADDLGETGVKVTVGKAARGELSLVDHGWSRR